MPPSTTEEKPGLVPVRLEDLGSLLAFRCDTCPAVISFFVVRHDGRIACAACWKRAGSPFPRRWGTDEEIYRREQATRERMKARGGTDKHLVASGKS